MPELANPQKKKPLNTLRGFNLRLARPARLELATHGFEVRKTRSAVGVLLIVLIRVYWVAASVASLAHSSCGISLTLSSAGVWSHSLEEKE